MKHELLKKVQNAVFANKRYLAAAFIFAILLIFFTTQVKAFLIISALGFAASVSTIYKRSFNAPPIFELMTLTIVMVSVLYGPLIGSIFAIIVSIVSEMVAGAVDVFTVIYIGPRIIMAVTASFFPEANFAMLGMWMSILFNALQQPIYFKLTDVEKRLKGVYFTAFNIPINIFLFKLVGAPLYELLKAIV